MSSSPSSSADPGRLYHLELRQFPHNMCRFNVGAEELRVTILEPWAADRWVELGERKWDPRHAKLTVLEGPRIPPAQLSMGRGWRAAQRQSRDVTEQLLAATAEALARGAGGAQTVSDARASTVAEEGETDLAADSLGLELLSQMGPEQTPLHRAWRLAATRDPSGPASDALALAERAVTALLRARLVVLLRAAGPDAAPTPIGEEDAVSVLQALESWTGAQVWMRRA